MKIAVNTRFLLKNKLEGIGKFTQETLRRIVMQHPECEFIFLFDRPYDPSFVFADNVTPVVLAPPARHPVLWWIWFEVAVARALRQHRPDAFLSPDGYLTLRTRVPTLTVIHDLAFVHYPEYVSRSARWYYRYFTPRFVRKAARVATVSTFSAQDLTAQYDLAPERIDVVYNGCDDRFVPLDATTIQAVRDAHSDGAPYFLYLGAIHPRKNVARLVQAFDQFKAQDTQGFKLLLAGRMAWQTDDVVQAIHQSQYATDIVHLDYVPDAELPRIVAAAHALTYVSLFEGFGIPILEAMYCDVPSITSRRSSMPEVAGDAGLLVDPTSVADIEAAMTQLANDEALRHTLVTRGRSHRQQFTWALTAQRLWASLERTLVEGAG